MAFSRPSLATLVGRARSDLRSRLGLSGPLLRRRMSDVVASSWAGVAHLMHGYLDWRARQIFATTAEKEALYEQAGMYGIYPTAATFAAGTVTATGVDESVIPVAGTFLIGPGGVRYRVTAEAEIDGGTAEVAIEAVIAGAGGNLDEGEALSFESPIDGVDAGVVVAAGGIAGGFDQQDPEGVRTRLLLRKREPPTGGSDQDYKAWALAVAGVTRAWVYRHEDGLGTVAIRCVLDNEDPIFPDSGKIEEVQAKIDAERPTTAEVTVKATTGLAVDFTLSVVPDTAAVKNAVEAELADLFRRVGAPGNGAGLGTVLLAQIRTAIGVASGVEDYDLAVPSADVVPGVGELAVLGTVTWT